MKKKLLSLLLVLVLVIGVTALTTMAEEATPAEHKHCICGGHTDGRGDHDCDSLEEITWTPFSLELCETMSDGRLIIPAGNYYLAEDLKTDKAFVIAPDTEVSICLNGKTLESSARVFRVHGTLNIAECTNGTGKVLGTNGGDAPVFYVAAAGHINHYRGILRASQDSKTYGGVGAIGNDATAGIIDTAASGSYTMYGGTLDASAVTLNKDSKENRGSGGAVVIFGSTTAPCSFTQYGGTIKGAKSVATNGAAIHVPSSATVKLMGGKIENGKASGYGNGVYVTKGADFTVGGNANIGDVFVPDGATIAVDALTNSVGISAVHTNFEVLAICDSAASAAKLTSNVDGRPLKVTEVEGKFQVALANHGDHCVCGGNLTGAAAENHTCSEIAPEWTALTAQNIVRDAGITVASDRETESKYNMFAQSGHYYLTEDIKLEKNFEIRPGQEITICLNGYTLTTGHNASVFRVTGGKLNICDCTGKGMVRSGWAQDGRIVYLLNQYADVNEGVTVNIYGGTLKNTGTNKEKSGGIIRIASQDAAAGAVLNIYGGTLTGGTARTGGIIYMANDQDAVLNIYGGTLEKGATEPNPADTSKGGIGGIIYLAKGELNIHGGTITGATGAAGKNCGNIYQGNGVTNIYGGTISNGASGAAGGNLYAAAGEVNMFGGTITGGTATTNGGNIYVNGATFKMEGGTVSEGVANSTNAGGGNVYVAKGEFRLINGTISNGESQYHGGGVMVNGGTTIDNAPKFYMEGGSVVNNTAAERGGNIYIHKGVFEMTGGTVTGGKAGSYGLDLGSGAASPISLTLNGKVTIGELGAYGNSNNDYAWAIGENFSTDKPIKVSAQNLDKVIKNVTPDLLASFIPASETAQLTIESGNIYLRDAAEHYACYCGGSYLTDGSVIGHTCNMAKKWIAVDQAFINNSGSTTEQKPVVDADGNPVLDAEGNPTYEEVTTVTGFGSPVLYDNKTLGGTYYHVPAGSYYLTEDITLEHGLRITSETSVYIDLNGHKLIAPEDNARPLYVQGNLYVCDSSYDATKQNKAEQFQGAVIGKRASNYNIMYISASGTVRIFGGKFYSEAEGAETNIRIAMVGTLYVFDGYFEGGDRAGNGRLFELQDNTAHTQHGDLRFYHATAVGGKTTSGAVVSLTQSGQRMIMYSGEMIGGTASGNGGAINATGGSSVTILGGVICDGVALVRGGNINTDSGATLTISGGVISGGENKHATNNGGNICANGPVTITGGTITGGKACEGGNISLRGSGEMTISGKDTVISDGIAKNKGGNFAIFGKATIADATISGGVAGLLGGNIYGFANKTDITINSGLICGGSVIGTDADGNGTVDQVPADLFGYNLAMDTDSTKAIALTINGGTISGAGEGNLALTGTHIMSADGSCVATVSGAPVIDDLRLGSDRMLTVGELTEDANIGISRFEITGLFASGAAQYANYFHGTVEGVSVAAEGEDLILVSENPYWAFDAQANVIGPAKTMTEALAMTNVSFIRLVDDVTTDETVTGPVYVDLYGHDLIGLTVNGDLYVVDMAGHDYEEGVLGSLQCAVTGNINGGKAIYEISADGNFHATVKYVMLPNEDGTYSIHRISLAITHISLDAVNDALGFKATVYGDSAVQAAVTGFGFIMGVEGGNAKTYSKSGNHGADGVFTLRLNGIMAANGGEMPILGQAFVKIGEETLTSAQQTTSMKNTIESVEAAVAADANAYTQAQIESVQALIAQFESKMEGWDIDSIKAWTAPTPAE